ncbi:uncharacterized protein V1510DRAFT_401927 [Dipodascopsis tothii]|uniref:uncharacterized protein n=1 Tax=Dipodascopsis tothii TaxID=44089 RepID=UPI0034CDB0F8
MGSQDVLLYTISLLVRPDEYRKLKRRLSAVARTNVKGSTYLEAFLAKLPTPETAQKASDDLERIHLGEVRQAIRVAIVTYSVLTVYDGLLGIARGDSRAQGAAAATGVLSAYRVVLQATSSVRTKVTLPEARKFRNKYRRTTRLLRSPLFPPMAAGLASSVFLTCIRDGKRRSAVALYTFTVAVDLAFNALRLEGAIHVPDWLGAWAVFPFALSELLYTFLYNVDCAPPLFNRFVQGFSSKYIIDRPDNYPFSKPWPSPMEVLDGLKEISLQKYPPFNSSILYPDSYALPDRFQTIGPIVSQAHPGLKHLSCALLHPFEESCMQNFVSFAANQFVTLSKYIVPFYAATAIFKLDSFQKRPSESWKKLAESMIRSNVFLTMSTATAWAGLCFSQNFLPNKVAPMYRVKIIGFIAGLWAAVDSSGGRLKYVPAARSAFEAYWKVLKKTGRVRPLKHGEIIVFALSLSAIVVSFNRQPRSVHFSIFRKALCYASGRNYDDVYTDEPDDVDEASGEISTSPTTKDM